jgi:hypothetical protein
MSQATATLFQKKVKQVLDSYSNLVFTTSLLMVRRLAEVTTL